MHFDNRGAGATRLYHRALIMLGRKPRNAGQAHYVFDVADKRIAYCYIRKNASTAFKRLILDSSPHQGAILNSKSRIQFMDRYHRESELATLEACKFRIFVYRDALERMASLFVNKFVLRSGSDNIARDVEQVLGKPFETMSFSDLIKEYIGRSRNVNRLNPHVWEQIYHLRPMHYTHAISIDHLENEMRDIIGADSARQYFGKKVNSANKGKRIDESEVSSVRGALLHDHWQRTGELPGYSNLLRPDLSEIISRVYRRDITMITKVLKGADE